MDPIALAQQFIRIDSVTDQSNDIIAQVQAQLLEKLGFEIQRMSHRDLHGVEKVVVSARRLPKNRTSTRSDSPGLAFACHNDVVSIEGWNCTHGGPFDANLAEGRLWGRGACDMKGPTASLFAALASLPTAAEQSGPLLVFITGDEEAGMAGARMLAEHSSWYKAAVERQTPLIITEPTELKVVNAHKGGCHFTVSSSGVAAHSSTCDGLNANWQLIPFLNYLRTVAHRCESDESLKNNRFTPPSLSLNIVLDNEPAAFNITVGRAKCHVFFRPMPDTPWRELLEEIRHIACDMELQVSSIRALQPVLTPADRPIVQAALRVLQQSTPATACYATDGCCFDGRVDVVVIGPGSIEQAHRHDEWIDLAQLTIAQQAYAKLLKEYAFA